MDIAMVKTQPSGIFARASKIEHATSAPSAAAEQISAVADASPKPQAAIDPQIDSCKGWITVVGSFIIHVWALGMTYAFGVFIKPLQNEFHVQREPIVWLNGLCSFSLLTSGIGTGYLADRWSYRGTAIIGALLIVVGMELSSVTTELWQLFLTYGLIQGVGGGFCFIPAVSVISEWFQATGLAVSGSGVGTLILPLIAQPIIDRKGWRWCMRIFGFLALVSLLAGAMCIIRRKNAVKRRRAFVGKAVVMTRTFLFLGSAIFFYSLGFLVPITNCVAHAQDKHIKNAQALLAAVGAASTVGRVFLGFVADKLGKVNVLKVSMLVMTIATPFWPFVPNFWTYLIFCIIFGFAAGSFIALVAPTAGDYFGTSSIAGVAGIIYGLCAVGNLLGPPMSARMYDKYDDYIAAAIFSAACTGIGFFSLWGLEPAPKALAKFQAKERQREEKRKAKLRAADPNGGVEMKATAVTGNDVGKAEVEKEEATAETAPV